MSSETTLSGNNGTTTAEPEISGFDVNFEAGADVYGTLHIPVVVSSGTIPRIKRKGSASVSSPQKTSDATHSRRLVNDTLQETEVSGAGADAASQHEEGEIRAKRTVKQASQDPTLVNLSGSENEGSEAGSENEVEKDSFDDALIAPIVSRLAEVKIDADGRLLDGEFAAAATLHLDATDEAAAANADTSAGAEAELSSAANSGAQADGEPDAPTVSQLAAAEKEVKQLQDVDESDEMEAAEFWLRRHTRHVFVLSDSGKPIYSRHGREDRLVTEMGLIKALYDFVGDAKRNEALQVLRTDDCQVVYLARHHLLLVGVSHAGESPAQIAFELSYVFSYIVSQLTIRQIDSIFAKRANFDLRRLLSDADRCVGKLLQRFETDPSLLLGAYHTLPIAASVRDQVQNIVATSARDSQLAFALLLADAQLVTAVRIRDKKCEGHPQPADVHLLVNMVQTNSTLRHGEFWAPVCLPSFDAGYFLYCYVHFLDERAEANASEATPSVASTYEPKICLLLLSVSNDKFFDLSRIQRVIKEKMERQNLIELLRQATQRSSYTLESLGHFGNPELWHFVYRHRSCSQLTAPSIGMPYSSLVRASMHYENQPDGSSQSNDGANSGTNAGNTQKEDDEHVAARYVLARYSRVHKYLHSQVRPFRTFVQRMHHETVCGCLTSEYELYALFSPYSTLPIISQTIQRIARWAKSEESRLFAMQTWPVFAQ